MKIGLRWFFFATVLFGMFISASLVNAAQDEIINNASIIDLKKSNFGDAEILGIIKTSKCNFDTSIGELKKLKEIGVSGEIIQAMIATKASASPNATTPATTDLNDPLTPHAAGIWVLIDTNGGKEMKKLEFEHARSGSHGSRTWRGYGAKVEDYIYLSGSKADLQLSHQRPQFYFYFVSGNQLAAQGGSAVFVSAQTPKEFLLAKFQVKKEKNNELNRELSLYKGTAYSTASTVDKSLVEFESAKVGEGVYKIVPKIDLSDGEYVFLRNDLADQNSMTSMTPGPDDGQLFAFGIQSTNVLSVQ